MRMSTTAPTARTKVASVARRSRPANIVCLRATRSATFLFFCSVRTLFQRDCFAYWIFSLWCPVGNQTTQFDEYRIKPDKLAKPKLWRKADTSVVLQFGKANPRKPVTSYEVSYKHLGEDIIVATEEREVSINKLERGAQYGFRVRAMNEDLAGDWSATLTVKLDGRFFELAALWMCCGCIDGCSATFSSYHEKGEEDPTSRRGKEC